MDNDLSEKYSSLELLDKFQNSLNNVQNSISIIGNDFSNPEFIKLKKEEEKFLNIISLLKKLHSIRNEISELKILKEDDDFTLLAESEIDLKQKELETILLELEKYNSLELENDSERVIIEIRPGVGGIEASLFAEELFNSYISYCLKQKLKFEILNVDYNQEGGIKEGIFIVKSLNSYGLLRFEGGVHRVQRVPKTESSGRIHTSTCSVVTMPVLKKIEFDINPNDLRIDVYRSSGPGGQSVNTTDSAVRITHLPTKIIVTCQNNKSQHKNKEQALEVLKNKLFEIEKEKKQSREEKIRSELISGGDRSSKIRTYNFPQNRITDHRINKSWFNIVETLVTGMEEVINQTNQTIRKQLIEKLKTGD